MNKPNKYFYLILLILSLVFTNCNKEESSSNHAYMNDMPSVDKVIRTENGKNSFDTHARQIGALKMLALIVQQMAGGKLNAQDELLMQQYNKAADSLSKKYNLELGTANSSHTSAIDLAAQHYEFDDNFLNDEIFGKLVGIKSQEQFDKRENNYKQEQENKALINSIFTSPLLWSIILIAGGVLLARPANKTLRELDRYKFENTTSGGVVQFRNYEESLKYNTKQKRAKFTGYVAGLMTLLGIIILVIYLIIK